MAITVNTVLVTFLFTRYPPAIKHSNATSTIYLLVLREWMGMGEWDDY